MSGAAWWLFIGGTVFTLAASFLFLATLVLGLRKRRWWPLTIVIVAWLVLMVAFSAWDSGERRDTSRRRAQDLAALSGAHGLDRVFVIASPRSGRGAHGPGKVSVIASPRSGRGNLRLALRVNKTGHDILGRLPRAARSQ